MPQPSQATAITLFCRGLAQVLIESGYNDRATLELLGALGAWLRQNDPSASAKPGQSRK